MKTLELFSYSSLENVTHKVDLDKNITCGLTILDIPAKEDIDLRDTYYRNADAAIVVVDLTDRTSIEMAGTWKQDFCKRVTKVIYKRSKDKNGQERIVSEYIPTNGYNMPVLLLGNKFDIIQDQMEEEFKDDSNNHSAYNKICQDLSLEENLDKKLEFSENSENEDEDRNDVIVDDSSLGKKKKFKKPPCVKLLEHVGEEFDFISSIAASAKHSTSSKAFHLILKKLLELNGYKETEEKSTDENTKNDNETEEIEEEFFGMQKCDIEEVDALVVASVSSISKVEDLYTFYNLAEKKMKQIFNDIDIIEDIHCSLEDCVYGLRRSVFNSIKKELQILPFEEFVRLVYEDSEEETDDDEEEITRIRRKLPRGVPEALDTFNAEYSTVCSHIIKQSPNLLRKLENLDAYFEGKSANAYDITPLREDGQPDVKKVHGVKKICETNRARLKHYIRMLQQLCELIRNCKEKVNLALLW
ncbi:DgyrCDS10175 [Dimorphilus gyrociliatus]|uniref:DgyrCDS10175 n=1 Tax=Dimorphilus gyrociliatus TaxID=2664684 RepID=A0A7I8VZB9_9ANNE|nr:DgyrCDS10175 [Dimorphilus gyrociliatus]